MGYASHDLSRPEAPAAQLSTRAGFQQRALEQEIKRKLASAATPSGQAATQRDALQEFGLM